jgi:hypothetical protein
VVGVSSEQGVTVANNVRVAQPVNDDVEQKLLDLGVDPEKVERVKYVNPPLEVDTYLHHLYLENGEQSSFKKRPKRPNESAWCEAGSHVDKKRDVLEDMRDRGDEHSLLDPPDVPDEVYDPDLDWSEYRAYRCHEFLCRHECINPVGYGPEKAERCWSCYREESEQC